MTREIRRNAFLLAGGLVCNSGMFQLAAALSSLTLVAVGRLAADVLGAPYVRHPSHGGALAFAEGLRHTLAV